MKKTRKQGEKSNSEKKNRFISPAVRKRVGRSLPRSIYW